MFFDGSDVGLGDENGSYQIDGFAVISPNEILMSLGSDGFVPGIVDEVEDTDILKFTATSLGENTSGTFELYFYGRNVGLTNNDEDIDSVELLSDGRILVSTRGPFSVPGFTGQDEDIIAFTPTALGSATAGTWAMYFDGSDVDLGDKSKEDLTAIAVDSTTGDMYFSTSGDFNVTNRKGHREDVFVFQPTLLGVPTAGSYLASLFFDGNLFGIGSNHSIYGFDLP